MASKKSIYSSLLLLTLTLGAFVPVTSFADDGIATNDAVLTQPTTDRAALLRQYGGSPTHRG